MPGWAMRSKEIGGKARVRSGVSLPCVSRSWGLSMTSRSSHTLPLWGAGGFTEPAGSSAVIEQVLSQPQRAVFQGSIQGPGVGLHPPPPVYSSLP